MSKLGDEGITYTGAGKQVKKSDIIIEVCGEIDELVAFIGLLNTSGTEELSEFHELQVILLDLAGKISNPSYDLDLTNIIKKIENMIKKAENEMPKLNHFILPGGSEYSALSHVVRSIVRRVERHVVRYKDEINPNMDPNILVFLNRLSNYFFIIGRYYNHIRGIKEIQK
jgi:cob(I)alamin adenosyltransferase